MGVNLPIVLMCIVKTQETGNWEQVAAPGPAFTGSESPVRAILLKKCIVSQLALAGGAKHTVSARLYGNAAGFCKGDPLRSNDPAWPNFWRMAMLLDDAEPACPTDNAASPDSLVSGWTVGRDDGLCPNVRAIGPEDGFEGP